MPRSKKQLIDLASGKRHTSPANEIGDLLAMSAELEGFLWYHADIPTEVIIPRENEMAVEMREAAKKMPFSFDGTFNFGKFEVTPFTYRHPNLEKKSKNVAGKWVPAVMLGPTILQDDKLEASYTAGTHAIAENCSLTKEKISIIIDGEVGRITSCDVFSKADMYRCTRHFKANCVERLHAIGIKRREEQAVILQYALVDAENNNDLKKRIENIKDELDQLEKSI